MAASFDFRPQELRRAALHWLAECNPRRKAKGVRELGETWRRGGLALDTQDALVYRQALPGRPERPALVPPRDVGRRSVHTAEGRAALIHALAHIEFNAINLALDAIWRFPGMPPDFYADWLKVADEEALHFSLLADHLHRMGVAYGDLDAHSGLWDMAEKTSNDLLGRMAIVPRTLEARGLDATPAIRAKLAKAGDDAAAAILDIILRDEIGHVAVGNRWYNHLCAERGLDPQEAYAALATRYDAPQLRGPFNIDARRAAGFSESEIAALK